MQALTFWLSVIFIIGLVLGAQWLFPSDPDRAGAVGAAIGCAAAMFMQWRFNWFPGRLPTA
jgi:hypothetical protein